MVLELPAEEQREVAADGEAQDDGLAHALGRDRAAEQPLAQVLRMYRRSGSSGIARPSALPGLSYGSAAPSIRCHGSGVVLALR